MVEDFAQTPEEDRTNPFQIPQIEGMDPVTRLFLERLIPDGWKEIKEPPQALEPEDVDLEKTTESLKKCSENLTKPDIQETVPAGQNLLKPLVQEAAQGQPVLTNDDIQKEPEGLVLRYRIISGEVVCQEFPDGTIPDGWWKTEDKFTEESKAKARKALEQGKNVSCLKSANGGKQSPLRAIRELCSRCMGWNPGDRKPWKKIRECSATECPLHPFREGKNPFNILHLTPEQRKRRSDLAKERFKNKERVLEN